jgi:hypothetical protein
MSNFGVTDNGNFFQTDASERRMVALAKTVTRNQGVSQTAFCHRVLSCLIPFSSQGQGWFYPPMLKDRCTLPADPFRGRPSALPSLHRRAAVHSAYTAQCKSAMCARINSASRSSPASRSCAKPFVFFIVIHQSAVGCG